MAYIYNDEDNEPMTEENIEVEERDCEHCKNHDGKYCQVWDCSFSPKEEPEQLPAAKNCHERCPYSKECYVLYKCKGSHDPSFPWECAIYDKLMDRAMEAEAVRRELLPFTEDYEGEELDDDGT